MIVTNTYFANEKILIVMFKTSFKTIKFKLLIESKESDESNVNHINAIETIELKSNFEKNQLVIPLQKNLDNLIILITEINGKECEEYYHIKTNETVNNESSTSVSLNEMVANNRSIDIEQFGNGLASLIKMGMN